MGSGSRKKKGKIINSSTAYSGSPSSKRLTAIVVEDDRANRMTHRVVLTQLGIETLEAVNGRQVMELCAAGMVFDLILIDIDMDSPQVIRMLRQLGVKCKIVGVTENSNSEDMEEYMNAGLDAFYIKPISHVDLMTIVEELCSH